MTAYLESESGLALPRSSWRDVSETTRIYDLNTILLESRIAELERQLDGWAKLDSESGREFNREFLGKITDLARVNYLKNPLINRGVEIGALYVWGQQLSVSTADEDVQAVIDRFWDENRATLTGQQAARLLEVELEVAGNVFLALFPDRISGSVRVRPAPMEEIRKIVSNPEDRTEVWYYLREWREQPLDGGAAVVRRALYPDWQYRPETRPERTGDLEIRWDSPILHIKAGAFPHWRWGVSEVYPALDWARAYKELLEDDATRSRALAKFAWKLSTGGGRQGVAAAKTRFGTTLGGNGAGETNPPPVAGSSFIAGEGTNLDPIKIAGANMDPDHSRPARLMASAALGIADHMFDADVGNHATASTLDRPTELRFSERRSMWIDHLGDLCQWVIDRDIEAPGGILPKITPADDDWRHVDLSFPDLLERSVTDRVDAVVKAATLGGTVLAGSIAPETVSRLLLSALGIEDVDGEVAKLDGTEPDGAEREAFVRALRKIEEALRDRPH